MDAALLHTREASTGLKGKLRLGYTKGYEHSDQPKHLRRFHHEYPNILISCYRHDTDKLAAGLLSGDYDIIFTRDSINIHQEEMLSLRLFERVPLCVALYANHPLAQKKQLSRKDLKQENILFMSPSGTGDSFGDAHYIRLYQQAGYQPNILLRSSDMESILMMIAAEEGISIVSEYTQPGISARKTSCSFRLPAKRNTKKSRSPGEKTTTIRPWSTSFKGSQINKRAKKRSSPLRERIAFIL